MNILFVAFKFTTRGYFKTSLLIVHVLDTLSLLSCSLGNKLGKLACKQEEPGVCSSALNSTTTGITTNLKVHNYIANL